MVLLLLFAAARGANVHVHDYAPPLKTIAMSIHQGIKPSNESERGSPKGDPMSNSWPRRMTSRTEPLEHLSLPALL